MNRDSEACECGDVLSRHAAQEGMCLDCDCFGWTQAEFETVPEVDLWSDA